MNNKIIIIDCKIEPLDKKIAYPNIKGDGIVKLINCSLEPLTDSKLIYGDFE